MSYRSLSFIPDFSDQNIFSKRFNQIDKIFSNLTGETPISETPRYNLSQISEIQYQLTVSIPGYKEEELDISVHNNKLSIQGKKEDEKKSSHQVCHKWLHKGIVFNNFSLHFKLDHKIKVKKAELSLGLLKLDFECNIPEEEKPKKISINITDEPKKIDKK